MHSCIFYSTEPIMSFLLRSRKQNKKFSPFPESSDRKRRIIPKGSCKEGHLKRDRKDSCPIEKIHKQLYTTGCIEQRSTITRHFWEEKYIRNIPPWGYRTEVPIHKSYKQHKSPSSLWKGKGAWTQLLIKSPINQILALTWYGNRSKHNWK